MKRILFMAAAVASFNVFAVSNNAASSNFGVTAQLNLQEAARGNVEGSVSYDNLLNNKVSVVVSGSYNAATQTGENVSDVYSRAVANYAPYTVDRQAEGFGAAVAGNWFLNANTESSAFAGVKVGFAKGKFASYERPEAKEENKTAAEGDKKEEKVESKVVRSAEDRETTLVRATVPVGYQWVSGNLVVSTSAEFGASYDVNAKEKAFRPHVEANLLSVGMKF